MFRKFFRGIFTIIGGLIGYEVYELCSYLLKTVDPGQGQAGLSGTEEVWAISVCVIIFGIIFYRIAPILTRKSRKVADNIGTDLQGVSPNDLIGGTIGLILGLVIAFLLTQIYQSVVSQKSLYLTITITIYAFLAFLGWVIGSKKGSELLNLYAKERKALLQAKAGYQCHYRRQDSGDHENRIFGGTDCDP